MKRWLSFLMVGLLVGCADTSVKTDESEQEEEVYIPAIIPSTQTSDEIISLIQNGSTLEYEEIETKIEQASGIGPDYGVDENNSLVSVMFTYEKYFGKNNWIFCHESTNDCQVEVDNSTNQRYGREVVYSDNKIFMLNLDRRVHPGSYGRTLAYYDTNTREFNKNAVDMNFTGGGLDGETGSLTKGVDGYLYAGASNHYTDKHYVSYAKINPKDLSDVEYHTGYYTDLYVNRLRDIAADMTHVYQAMGDGPWELVAVDTRVTPNSSKKLLEGKFFQLDQLKDGVGMRYTDNDGVKHTAWLFNGEVYPVDTLDSTPPWYKASTHPDNHPFADPTGYWAYAEAWSIVPGIGKPKPNVLQLGTIYPEDDGKGRVKLGYLRNDIQYDFSARVDTYVQPLSSLRVIDKERMMMIGRSYSGSAMLNLNNDTSKFLGSYHVSPNVYKTFLDYNDSKRKKFMFSGYPSATSVFYTLDDANSRFSKENMNASLGYLRHISDRNNLGDGIDVDIHRTTGMVQVGEMVYFIGMQYRSGVGGALIGWNTRTGEKWGIKKGVFDSYQPRDMILIGGKIAIATQAMDNTYLGGAARPATPKILIFDPKTESFVKEYTPVEGLATVDCGRIQTLDDRYIIGLTNNGSTSDNQSTNYSSRMFLYMIDTYTDEVVMQKTIEKGNYMRVEPHGAAFIDGFTFKKHGDYIYTWLLARSLSTIDKNGEIEVHGLMPYQSKMEFANGYIYFSGDKKLRKLPNPKE